MSYAALLRSIVRFPAISPLSSEGSAPLTSRPVAAPAARSTFGPDSGPGPFCPKK